MSSGTSFVSELINVSDVLEHVNCVPSSRMRKRTHDAEFVQFFFFWIQQETTSLQPQQRHGHSTYLRRG